MKDQVTSLINQLPGYQHWKFWLSIAFILKLVWFVFCICSKSPSDIGGFWGSTWIDSPSYLAPIESLVDKGEYQPDYRMPGYATFYLPLYYFFPKGVALNLLIIVQLILASVTTYFIARIALMLFEGLQYFYLTFLFYGVGNYVALWNTTILTESLTTSFLIIAVFLFLLFLENKRTLFLILSGACITQVIFLRPVFLPVLFIFPVLLISFHKQLNAPLKHILLFLLTFVVIDGSWMYRNYSKYGIIAPLTKTVYYPEIEEGEHFPLIQFVQSWGGSFLHWEAGAEIRWFGTGGDIDLGEGMDRAVTLPDYIYTSKFNIDSLKTIRDKYIAYPHLSEKEKAKTKAYLNGQLNIYTASIKEEKPVVYYLQAPLSLTKKFLLHSGTYNLFPKNSSALNIFERLIKTCYSLLYLFVLASGFMGIMLLSKKVIRMDKPAIIVGIVVYTTLVHPVVLRFSEARYLVPAWPFLIICSVYFIVFVYNQTVK